MKKTNQNYLSRGLYFAIIISGVSCQTQQEIAPLDSETVTKTISKEESIERGKYLVDVIGCADCHSPKSYTAEGMPFPNPELAFSGHPAQLDIPEYDPEIIKNWVLFNGHNTVAVGPWGISYAANITSDPTGIGTWSEEQFFNAMRNGKYKGLEGSRALLPPMPWPNYSNLTDEDLRAIYNYLKSTKPVENIVPPAVINTY